MATELDSGGFATYWKTVEQLLGGANPNHKTAAQTGTAAKAFAQSGAINVRKLWAAMGAGLWASPKSVSKGNWIWRTQVDRLGRAGTEVALERTIFKRGGCERWTYQMPTASGLEGSYANRRTSIDLVRKAGEGHFTFIELKCVADNPLYAAFEVLGYGLAYLHARAHLDRKDASAPEVLSARRIELLVLGPREWYEYKRRNGLPVPYPLAALEQALAAGLAELANNGPATPPQGMGFRFAAYDSNPTNTATAAQEIVDMFGGKVPWVPLTFE